jgi:small subunit ribosomal protein S6
MNNYLVTLLIKENVDEKERKELLASLTKKMGKVEKEDLWGSRSLSYPIMHQGKAYYAHYEFQSEPASISDIDKSLKLNEDVLRYLIVRV